MDEPRKIIDFDESTAIRKPTYTVVQGKFYLNGEQKEITSIHFTYDEEEAKVALDLVKKNPLFPKGIHEGTRYKYGIKEGTLLLNPAYAKEFSFGGKNE